MAQLTQIEKMIFLHSADLFAHCRADEVLRVAAIAREQLYEKDEKIYEESEPSTSLYAVVHGGVRLENAERARQAGPLQSFGVEEVLVGRIRRETAIAEKETLVLEITSDDFFDLLSQNIEIVKALFRRYLKAARASSTP